MTHITLDYKDDGGRLYKITIFWEKKTLIMYYDGDTLILELNTKTPNIILKQLDTKHKRQIFNAFVRWFDTKEALESDFHNTTYDGVNNSKEMIGKLRIISYATY